ncbi:hypothetical protein HUK65_14165 [Rhodobacteraceae bacterium 2376]|uniref:Uncharacterized protein n=1 Tax=Rhabdonatronobacter sediminivivens TaxID=2743469 RepID=A0A7Z0KZE4_9RHOB|nr:hypothetical protein [Rhabdonatronobacter sediminivivens]NYS26135.1 hypothetical protein [Rhabdonatronobacter sediminivivens]
MARFGFRTLSGGMGPVSYSNIYVAFIPGGNCDDSRRLYRFGQAFGYATTVALGYSMSAVEGGFPLPAQDTARRSLPLNWAGKRLRLEVAGSHYPLYTTDTKVKFQLTEYDAARREHVLYEDTFMIPCRGTNVGGINVEGHLHQMDIGSWWRGGGERVYNSIMYPSLSGRPSASVCEG